MISRQMVSGQGVSGQALGALLLALLALDNLLLPAYLGLSPFVVALAVVVFGAAIGWLALRPFAGAVQVPLRVIGISFVVALGVFVLGGQGRLLFANADWQVRDAVLADMAGHPWPFAYMLNGAAVFLRAPLGMYLLPALAGRGHEWALLLSNAVRLALLLSLGWQLFDTNAKRWFALAGFLLFSGWDAVGMLFMGWLGAHQTWDHIETWSLGYQYSSHVTQAFWVPNHALAGWTCALTYELWRRGKAPIGLFAAAVPLTAIWSPLALMGAMPFVAVAGVITLARRAFTRADVALAGLALVLALPCLWFMSIDAGSVHKGVSWPVGVVIYIAIIAFEVLPFVVPPLLSRGSDGTQRLTLWVALLCLMLMPCYQVGSSVDFQMRSSIMPLAIVALAFVGWVARLFDQRSVWSRAALAYGLVALAIGAVTPAMELHRTLVMRPTPGPRCSLVGVWMRQTIRVAPTATYVARVSALPVAMRAMPVVAGVHEPAQCWDRDWMVRR